MGVAARGMRRGARRDPRRRGGHGPIPRQVYVVYLSKRSVRRAVNIRGWNASRNVLHTVTLLNVAFVWVFRNGLSSQTGKRLSIHTQRRGSPASKSRGDLVRELICDQRIRSHSRHSARSKMRIWTSLPMVRFLRPRACMRRMKSGVILKMRIWTSSSRVGL